MECRVYGVSDLATMPDSAIGAFAAVSLTATVRVVATAAAACCAVPASAEPPNRCGAAFEVETLPAAITRSAFQVSAEPPHDGPAGASCLDATDGVTLAEPPSHAVRPRASCLGIAGARVSAEPPSHGGAAAEAWRSEAGRALRTAAHIEGFPGPP